MRLEYHGWSIAGIKDMTLWVGNSASTLFDRADGSQRVRAEAPTHMICWFMIPKMCRLLLLFYGGDIFRRHSAIGSVDVHLDLVRLGGAGDDARDHRFRKQPAEGHFQNAVASFSAEPIETLDCIPVCLCVVAPGEVLPCRKARPLGRLFAASIFARPACLRPAGKKEAIQDCDSPSPEAIPARWRVPGGCIGSGMKQSR